MRNKRTNGIKIKGGIWRPAKFQAWEPSYYVALQKQTGIEYQSYGVSADGKCVHAGVTRHERMNRAIARQIQCAWKRWRTEYANPILGRGNPLPCPEVIRLVVFPVDRPDQAVSYSIQDSEDTASQA